MPDSAARLADMHIDTHPLAGQTVQVKTPQHPQIGEGPHEFHVEDWWDKMTGGSWADSTGNPAATFYALRAVLAGLPLDDEVVYGKIGPFGHIVHISEFVEVSA